jgi:hypothetical protein
VRDPGTVETETPTDARAFVGMALAMSLGA